MEIMWFKEEKKENTFLPYSISLNFFSLYFLSHAHSFVLIQKKKSVKRNELTIKTNE